MNNRIVELRNYDKPARSVRLKSALEEVADRLDSAAYCIKNGEVASGLDEIIVLAAYLRRINA